MLHIPHDVAMHFGITAGEFSGEGQLIYCESEYPGMKEELEFILGRKIRLEVRSSIFSTSTEGLKNGESTRCVPTQIIDMSKGESLESLIQSAVNSNASDIHLEQFKNEGRTRFRIDGKLYRRNSIPSEDYAALVNQIKVKANLDIAEKRLPQDGRFEFRTNTNDKRIDLRVSVIPSLHGEKVVLRLLGRNAVPELEDLGLNKDDLSVFRNMLEKQQGLILISGPTGSGKTTSLYAAISYLNNESRNIVTIEDPVEYSIEGINQVQVKNSIGLGFAQAMRAFLRQDPDVMMVGEIRDHETAEMAVRAALTGHLVLSTIHTNSAAESITRMRDLDIPSYLLASTLSLLIAQRLVRKLCDHCKEKEKNRSWFKCGNGCAKCNHTGYKGRIAVFEFLPVSEEIRAQIEDGRKGIYPFGVHVDLSTSFYELLELGKVSFEEVYPYLTGEKSA